MAVSMAAAVEFPTGDDILVGVDYYPEHWPRERWETDLSLMHEAGFNVVRLAEFSWVFLEPSEGEFDFEWLDRAVDLCRKHGIKVILGTPTAIMPAWLADEYPEALSLKADGTRTVWGGRRHNCFSDEDFARLGDRIVQKMVDRYGAHPAVIGWQIDNELGSNDCRCEKCRAGFQAWLKKKYGDLKELNRAWGNHFWGLTISDWKQIPIPDQRTGAWAISNPSASLDWQRFTSDQSIDFLDRQVAVLRDEAEKRQFITHNFMGLHRTTEYYKLARRLDFVSWDNYPPLHPNIPYGSSLAADVMRGLKKKNFLIMEQTAGPLGWEIYSRNPQPGELRKICYQQLAHGADGQIWFRWRTCTVGREQYWHGLLGHDGKAGRRYREAAKVAGEYRKLAPYLAGTTVDADVAVIYDYDSLWAFEIQESYPGASHQHAVKRYYEALVRAGVNVDVLKPGDDLDDYKLVVAPHLYVLGDDVAERLVDYVRGGGVLVTDTRTAVKDETNLAHDRTLPGLLAPALGIEIDEYESMGLGIEDEAEVEYGLRAPELGGDFTAIKQADWITPGKAETIATYKKPHLADFAAVTRHRYDNGVGWYVGTVVKEAEFYDALLAKVLVDADVEPLVDPPAGVEVSLRKGQDHELLFVINHTDESKTLEVPDRKKELLTGKTTDGELELEPFGVAVIELSGATENSR
jgi:beta-galactosidase